MRANRFQLCVSFKNLLWLVIKIYSFSVLLVHTHSFVKRKSRLAYGENCSNVSKRIGVHIRQGLLTFWCVLLRKWFKSYSTGSQMWLIRNDFWVLVWFVIFVFVFIISQIARDLCIKIYVNRYFAYRQMLGNLKHKKGKVGGKIEGQSLKTVMKTRSISLRVCLVLGY